MNLRETDIIDVAIFFEKANGNLLSEQDAAQLSSSKFAHYSAEQLESLIIVAIESASPQSRGRLYWVLGKRFNTNLLPNFNIWLENETKSGEVGNIYQILIALDSLGIQVFGKDRNGSYSYQEYELNLRDARVYLENHA